MDQVRERIQERRREVEEELTAEETTRCCGLDDSFGPRATRPSSATCANPQTREPGPMCRDGRQHLGRKDKVYRSSPGKLEAHPSLHPDGLARSCVMLFSTPRSQGLKDPPGQRCRPHQCSAARAAQHRSPRARESAAQCTHDGAAQEAAAML